MINFNSIVEVVVQWSLGHGIKVVAILIAAWILLLILKKVIRRLIKSVLAKTYKVQQAKSEQATEKRMNTLERVFYSTAKVVIWVLAIMMIIPEFGINIGPVLAAVGVAGLAFGFGAQYLIRDFLSGLFIILEDQYREGDVVKISNVSGVVEELNLRQTVLRDLNGAEHHIPNGEIKTTANLTKSWSRINLDIGVSYDTDLDKAIKVLNDLGNEFAKDKEWGEVVTQPPQVLGVNEFGESAIIIKVLGETKPGEQWNAAREFRKRIKQTFDKEGIEIPFPYRVVIQK